MELDSPVKVINNETVGMEHSKMVGALKPKQRWEGDENRDSQIKARTDRDLLGSRE